MNTPKLSHLLVDFAYPEQAEALADVVAEMKSEDGVKINGDIFEMTYDPELTRYGQGFYLSAPATLKNSTRDSMRGYSWVHVRVAGTRTAVFASPASIASAIRRRDIVIN